MARAAPVFDYSFAQDKNWEVPKASLRGVIKGAKGFPGRMAREVEDLYAADNFNPDFNPRIGSEFLDKQTGYTPPVGRFEKISHDMAQGAIAKFVPIRVGTYAAPLKIASKTSKGLFEKAMSVPFSAGRRNLVNQAKEGMKQAINHAPEIARVAAPLYAGTNMAKTFKPLEIKRGVDVGTLAKLKDQPMSRRDAMKMVVATPAIAKTLRAQLTMPNATKEAAKKASKGVIKKAPKGEQIDETRRKVSKMAAGAAGTAAAISLGKGTLWGMNPL